jgi:hypothetical protein
MLVIFFRRLLGKQLLVFFRLLGKLVFEFFFRRLGLAPRFLFVLGLL